MDSTIARAMKKTSALHYLLISFILLEIVQLSHGYYTKVNPTQGLGPVHMNVFTKGWNLRTRQICMSASDPTSVSGAEALLEQAALKKDVAPDVVLSAIDTLEKNKLRSRGAPRRRGEISESLRMVGGSWRLVFTTGDKKTQKKIGKLNYFPIKAVQSFDPATMEITNGVYLGEFALLKFYGTFSWIEEKTRLEFTFTQVQVIGIKFPFGNPDEKPKVQPAFNFIAIEDNILVARGAGGGLALWLRQ
mmetsp:Transcript_8798/g.13538  ORF Transcript_8798/g.13538 Transcript_8798/m.13538 type:complete len:247 (-) Transcript_8798:166-906(-)